MVNLPTKIKPFRHEPCLDLEEAKNRARLSAALAALDARLPLELGDAPAADGTISSHDPADPERVVAVAGAAGPEGVDRAVAAALAAAPEWTATRPVERGAVLLAAAELAVRRRAELAALMVRECGKTWAEADGEVAEVADLLRYFALEAERTATGAALPDGPGERNRTRLIPRGVVAAIMPWNFPLGLPAGVIAAALASGNPVVLKPAEQSPACAEALARLLADAGLPPGLLALVQGDGRTGAALAAHPQVATVAFTGSVRAGLAVASTAAASQPGQTHLKRVVAELGGKNCAIVAADADLDLATAAIIRSAFSFAGQKCSAVSRVIVEAPVAGELRERLGAAIAALRVGPGEDFATEVPPVIEAAAARRLEAAAAAAAEVGVRVASAARPDGPGHYVPPALFAELPDDAPMLREELFGPLLAFEVVPSAETAIARVDALPLALVGGLFTADPDLVAHAQERLPVGNLYVNRPTVGAAVGRQPFGGGRLSGSGHKSGGASYLEAFCDVQVVAERLDLAPSR